MRTKNSLKNAISAMIVNIISILIGIVSQSIFIKILGSEYLGLNSLFNNVMSMLAIVELGIGNAIIFNLYKPLAEKNIDVIKSLMQFYKKNYQLIGLIISILGIILIPFLRYIVDFNTISIDVNVYIVYILFLIDCVFSYFLAYKRSILYASEQNSIINFVHIGYILILNTLQLFFLFITKNYYLYLIIKIIMRIIENIIITIIANRKYPYLTEKKISKLDKTIEKDIYKNVKALFFHKISAFIVFGTDNIIISKYLGLAVVGLYSNYYLIINAVQNIFGQIIRSTIASIGNMLVTEKTDKIYSTFKKIRFLNFWLASFACTAILVILESFIKIWIGPQYLLSNIVLIILVINLYQNMTRCTYASFKEAAGIYYEDRYVPIIEAILNIIVSVVCCLKFGLAGVFIGTIFSSMALWCYSYPKFVYKNILKETYLSYTKETLGYFGLFIIIASITYSITLLISSQNVYSEFIYNVLIGGIIPNILMLIIFMKNDNFIYYKNKVCDFIKKRR